MAARWRVAHGEPGERPQHGEGAEPEDEIGATPAPRRDQPLRERAHHEHAHAHAGEGQTYRAALTVREPARDEGAARYPAHRAHARGADDPDHEIERSEGRDLARQ